MAESKKGLIQIYTGDGKGKTTAALGLAVRAAGQGWRVGFIQFLKNEPYGEHAFADKYKCFDIVQLSRSNSFTTPQETLAAEAQQTLAFATEQMLNGRFDLLILDEINVAVYKGLITVAQVLDLLSKKPDALELVLTGRYAPPELIERAELVTEMRLIKHPYEKGIKARKGIEY